MHYFYVLYSLKDNKLYKGYTSDPGKRFLKHQAGGNTSTKNRRPLVLIYLESFIEKKNALKKERWAKSLEGSHELIKILIDRNLLTRNLKLNVSSAD